MMMTQPAQRDERTVSVENQSYRWAYLFLSYGLLLSTAYRGLIKHEQAWDLLALVVLSGVVTTAFQGRQHVLTRRWAVVSAVTVAIAVVLAAAIVLIGRPHGLIH